MKFIVISILILVFYRSVRAKEARIEASSVIGDALYICVSREGRSTGRSYLGEQPLMELTSWSLESHEISLATGRAQSRWKANVKKELGLQNSVQRGFAGMVGENVYFKYASALYRGPIRGVTNRHEGVVLFNRHGLSRIGSFPTNLNWYAPGRPLPRVDGSLKMVFEAGTLLYTTNGFHQVISPLVESPALAEDWKGKRTGGFEGLRLGTFGSDGDFIWHLRFPPGRPRLNTEWDEPLELVQQVREQVQVRPVRHRGAAVLWDGQGSTMVLSLGKKSDWHLGVDHPGGDRTDLGRFSGSIVTDPTARSLVIILDSKAEGVLRWDPSREYESMLRLRVLRIQDGQLTDREVKVTLD